MPWIRGQITAANKLFRHLSFLWDLQYFQQVGRFFPGTSGRMADFLISLRGVTDWWVLESSAYNPEGCVYSTAATSLGTVEDSIAVWRPKRRWGDITMRDTNSSNYLRILRVFLVGWFPWLTRPRSRSLQPLHCSNFPWQLDERAAKHV